MIAIGEALFGKAFHKYSTLGDKPYFDADLVPITADLKANFVDIRKEIVAVLDRYDELAVFQDISPSQAYIVNDTHWRMFFFRAIGINFKKNQEFAPTVAKVLKRHPEVCASYVSILGPKTYLNPHKGPWSGIIRMHLGVVIPGHNECTLIVEKEPYHWQEGKVVLFDDTYEHMAINNTDKPRAILFLEVMRPLPQPWRFFNWLCLRLALLSPYVVTGYFAHRKWQKQFFGGKK